MLLPFEPNRLLSMGASGDHGRRPRVGCSACLLGERVRFDGGHKRNATLTESLAPLLELVPVCPEVESGMGTPRPPIQLVQNAVGDQRLLDRAGRIDWTEAMASFAKKRCEQLADLGLDGFLLKSASPSCALDQLPIFDVAGHELHRTGRGFFAEALCRFLPELVLMDADRLSFEHERRAFLSRVFKKMEQRSPA